jgi:hypothetical protein
MAKPAMYAILPKPAATQALPNVDPVYTWVRLAQRVPVRIAIDEVPPGVPLASGLTATITIRDGKANEGRTLERDPHQCSATRRRRIAECQAPKPVGHPAPGMYAKPRVPYAR